MRFRKSIKIMPGVRLNLSKSGISTSVGVRGLSLTMGGKGGTYLNYGIPGTGIYDRKKISRNTINSLAGSLGAGSLGSLGSLVGGSPGRSADARTPIYAPREDITPSRSPELESRGYSQQQVSPQIEDISGFRLELMDSGEIRVLNSYGVPIEDPAALRRVRKTSEYAEKLRALKAEKIEAVQQGNEQFLNIHRLTPKLKTEQDWRDELNSLAVTSYTPQTYSVPAPTLEESTYHLKARADKEVHTILGWKSDAKKQEYIDKNIAAFHRENMRVWEVGRDQFMAEENKRRSEFETGSQEIEQLRSEIENGVLTGNADYISSRIEEILSNLALPVQFSVDFDIKDSSTINVDLDLPEIEDLPAEQTTLSSAGRISVKQKTKTQMLQDYATCVHGLAFFFAGLFFNISPKIYQINIAAYTQRLDSRTGNIKDTYIYSVKFRRNIFSKLNIPELNPIDAFDNFANERNMLKTFEMKEIEIQ